MGEEIGILGEHIQPAVFILTDTVNESIYLIDGVERNLSFEVVNCSTKEQTIDFVVRTENTDLLSLLTQPLTVVIPAQSKIRIDSFCQVLGNQRDPRKNTAYLKISSSIGGELQDREHIMQIKIGDPRLLAATSAIKIFDRRSEELALFKYQWNGWHEPVSTGVITEGRGDKNGIPETGETFSIWIESGHPLDTTIAKTWHPIIPVYTGKGPDVELVDMLHHSFSTGRDVLSAQLKLKRKPTKDSPVSIPFQTEMLRVQRLVNDCHRDAADDFTYFYGEVLINEDGRCVIKSW
ncbi:MAG: hypothetical protein IPL46_18755 [Saprospiraceae bacterium]|nr:hypothetical protein [Saprospiraceae bacterium]